MGIFKELPMNGNSKWMFWRQVALLGMIEGILCGTRVFGCCFAIVRYPTKLSIADIDDGIGDKVAGFGYLPQLDHYFR